MDATTPPFDPVRHRRGGRPRKPDAERRATIGVRMSPVEREAAQTRAEKAGLSLSEFMRAASGKTTIRVTVAKDAPPAVIQQLRHMGNNVNQTLHEARRGTFASPETEAAAIAALNVITHELRALVHGPECL